MPKNKITTWTITSPLKFAVITFGLLILVAGLYILGLDLFSPNTTPPKSHIATLMLTSLILGIALQIHGLPHTNINKKSFVGVHNAQLMTLIIFLFLSFVPIEKYQTIVFFSMMRLAKHNPTLAILTVALLLVISLFFIGVIISNIYAKFLRAHTIGIPKWKIFACMPFGFAATWIPGYFLNTKDDKQNNITIKSKWYNTLTDWLLARKRTLITAFICTVLIAHFYMGAYSTLLTFAFATIFGLWLLQIGVKKFEKNISGSYMHMAIGFNIAMIIAFIFMISIRANEPQIIDNQNQITPETIEIIDTNQD